MAGFGFRGVKMAETGTTQLVASCFVPGITFHVILIPSWASRSRNSDIFCNQVAIVIVSSTELCFTTVSGLCQQQILQPVTGSRRRNQSQVRMDLHSRGRAGATRVTRKGRIPPQRWRASLRQKDWRVRRRCEVGKQGEEIDGRCRLLAVDSRRSPDERVRGG